MVHLGHLLCHDLSDSDSILSKARDLIRKANLPFLLLILLLSLVCCSPTVCHYMVLPLDALMSCHSLIKVSFNNILRRIWHLPRNCHNRILHLTASLPGLFKCYYFSGSIPSVICPLLFFSHFSKGFCDSSLLVYNHTRYNAMSGGLHTREYYQEDGLCATVIRHLGVFGPLKNNDLNQLIDTVCTN